MNRVDRYFLDRAKDISFIELKKDKSVKEYKIRRGLPLPIVTDNFIADIKKGQLEDEISLVNIIDVIIYLLGTDGEFKHVEEYREILFGFDHKIEDYILYNGLEYMKKEDFTKGAIYLRAIENLKRSTELSLFNYAMALENIALDLEDGLIEEFLLESTGNLERILDIRDDFPLAYYKLGFHYKHSEQYLKAKLVWQKYLQMDDIAERKDEIREELELIEIDVDFEEAVILISQGQYNQGLERLLKIKKHSNWWNIDYLIGLCLRNLNKVDQAIEYLSLAVENGGDYQEVYNELGISLFSVGNIDLALENLDRALELDENNYEVLFNRGLVYSHLGKRELAILDMEKAYEIYPLDLIKDKLNELEIL